MSFSFDCQKIRFTVVRRKCVGKRTRLRGCTFNILTSSSFSGDKNCSLVIFKCTSTLEQEFKGGKFSGNAKTKEVPGAQRQVCMNMMQLWGEKKTQGEKMRSNKTSPKSHFPRGGKEAKSPF